MVESELQFILEPNKRTKKEYLANTQLYSAFKTLDKYYESSQRDTVIGYVLPLSLVDFSFAPYVAKYKKSSNNEQDFSKMTQFRKRDQLHAVQGYFNNLNKYLATRESQELIFNFMKQSISSLHQDLNNGVLSNQESTLFNYLFLDDEFLSLNNPHQYLKEKGSNLYEQISKKGRLTGQQSIDFGYTAIKNL